jgi:hypothetical protein
MHIHYNSAAVKSYNFIARFKIAFIQFTFFRVLLQNLLTSQLLIYNIYTYITSCARKLELLYVISFSKEHAISLIFS